MKSSIRILEQIKEKLIVAKEDKRDDLELADVRYRNRLQEWHVEYLNKFCQISSPDELEQTLDEMVLTGDYYRETLLDKFVNTFGGKAISKCKKYKELDETQKRLVNYDFAVGTNLQKANVVASYYHKAAVEATHNVYCEYFAVRKPTSSSDDIKTLVFHVPVVKEDKDGSLYMTSIDLTVSYVVERIGMGKEIRDVCKDLIELKEDLYAAYCSDAVIEPDVYSKENN